MKLVIATPLYPPDTAPSASYVKELSARLSPSHQVSIVLYGHLPEYVAGVRYVCSDKRHTLPRRLWRFLRGLQAAVADADVLIVENGPSVELPALLISYLTKVRIVFIASDEPAYERAQMHWLSRGILNGLEHRADAVFKPGAWQCAPPLNRPEIHPLLPRPTDELAAYEERWQAHLTELEAAMKI